MDKNKVMEYQMMEQQIQSLSQNLQQIDQNLQQIQEITTTLDEFKTLKKGDKILVPVANGIFANATLDDVSSVRVNVGSNTVVKKDPDSAKKIMTDQIEELQKYKQEAVQHYSEMQVRMQGLQQELMTEHEKEESVKVKPSK